MAYDIISTDPWQDPQNPWPIYNSVYLKYSYDTGATDTILLTAFKYAVNEGNNTIHLSYKHPDGHELRYECEDYGTEGASAVWEVRPEEEFPLYQYETLSRTIPIKILNNNDGWTSTETLSGLSSLVITPNYNDRALWQTRRLRHLGYV